MTKAVFRQLVKKSVSPAGKKPTGAHSAQQTADHATGNGTQAGQIIVPMAAPASAPAKPPTAVVPEDPTFFT